MLGRYLSQTTLKKKEFELYYIWFDVCHKRQKKKSQLIQAQFQNVRQ